MGDHAADWKALPEKIIKLIAGRFDFLSDFIRFSGTCKSWNYVASELLGNDKPWKASKYPWLLLAEDTGLDLSAVKVSSLNAVQERFFPFRYFAFGDDQTREIDHIIDTSVADLFKNISSTPVCSVWQQKRFMIFICRRLLTN